MNETYDSKDIRTPGNRRTDFSAAFNLTPSNILAFIRDRYLAFMRAKALANGPNRITNPHI